MAKICPFCLGENVKNVGSRSRDGGAGTEGHLMECEDCEKWYWAESDEEAATLFSNCETALLHPMRCYPEVLDVVLSGGDGIPRRHWAEFNHVCAECPNGRYVPPSGPGSRLNNSARSTI